MCTSLCVLQINKLASEAYQCTYELLPVKCVYTLTCVVMCRRGDGSDNQNNSETRHEPITHIIS